MEGRIGLQKQLRYIFLSLDDKGRFTEGVKDVNTGYWKWKIDTTDARDFGFVCVNDWNTINHNNYYRTAMANKNFSQAGGKSDL